MDFRHQCLVQTTPEQGAQYSIMPVAIQWLVEEGFFVAIASGIVI